MCVCYGSAQRSKPLGKGKHVTILFMTRYNQHTGENHNYLVIFNTVSLLKVTKDKAIKTLLGKSAVPSGLVELNKYFRLYGPIHFQNHREDGMQVSVSTNFKYGSIIAHGKDAKELDRNIRDAILTSFEVPSSYSKEAGVIRVGEREDSYALA
jgi:hypothetical protein